VKRTLERQSAREKDVGYVEGRRSSVLAKALAETGHDTQTTSSEFPQDMYFLTVPAETYRAISDAAAKKGMTVAQVMQAAFRSFLSETQPTSQTTGPQLLTERK
jgi:hypothetical protein